MGTDVFRGESCTQCDCIIEIPYAKLDWNPDAEPRPLNWSKVPEWIALFLQSGWSFADMAEHARPRFAFQVGEIEDLRTVEAVMRDLWVRYSPTFPRFDASSRDVSEENAAVDRYERQKEELYEVLVNVLRNGEWRRKFKPADHPKIETVLGLINRRVGNGPPQKHHDD